MRIVYRPAGAGMTAAREAEIFAYRLAGDRPAGVENARRDGRVDIRDVALHGRSAIHHCHTGEADIVFQRDLLALEFAGGRTRDLGLDVPRAVPVLLGRGATAGQPRIADRGQLVRHLVKLVVSLESRQQALAMRGEIGLGKGEAELRRDLAQLLQCRRFYGIQRHGPLRRASRLPAAGSGARPDTARLPAHSVRCAGTWGSLQKYRRHDRSAPHPQR